MKTPRVLALVSMLGLASCATTGVVPKALLVCPDEPVPGTINRESELLDYVNTLRESGDHCRRNLRAVSRILKE
jgi:hypothetical protein